MVVARRGVEVEGCEGLMQLGLRGGRGSGDGHIREAGGASYAGEESGYWG